MPSQHIHIQSCTMVLEMYFWLRPFLLHTHHLWNTLYKIRNQVNRRSIGHKLSHTLPFSSIPLLPWSCWQEGWGSLRSPRPPWARSDYHGRVPRPLKQLGAQSRPIKDFRISGSLGVLVGVSRSLCVPTRSFGGLIEASCIFRALMGLFKLRSLSEGSRASVRRLDQRFWSY